MTKGETVIISWTSQGEKEEFSNEALQDFLPQQLACK